MLFVNLGGLMNKLIDIQADATTPIISPPKLPPITPASSIKQQASKKPSAISTFF